MSSKEEIKQELSKYQPTPAEQTIIRTALFDVVTLASVGAASLGLSGHLWMGFFTGLALGTAMGMNKGMRTLRNSLPQDSELRRLIHANDQLRKEAILLSQQQQEDDNKPVSKD
ncbi:hypothetical protein VTP01DRAFT_4612 [Rhizomucor pusillus]|uniref:uncharacterized protein n=1 Tax=Rhizomucor pusillus TaxID=4840 RepID=UPI0037430D09